MSRARLADSFFASRRTRDTIPLIALPDDTDKAWFKSIPKHHAMWLQSATAGISGQKGSFHPVPDAKGGLEAVYWRATSHAPLSWALAHLPASLPDGRYVVEGMDLTAAEATRLAFGWAQAQLPDNRYRTKVEDREPRELIWPAGADRDLVSAWVEGVTLSRRLVNTPAEDLGPQDLSEQARTLTKDFGGKFNEVVGRELIAEGFPAAYAVGKGATAERAPRVMEMTFKSSKSAPTVALVGKGVVYDTGGLDIKPRQSMRHMKKDMGGAAVVLGVAKALLEMGANLNIHVVIGAVENAVSAEAMRPGDVLQTRKGLTVEVGDTDAEGRLVLADCLTYAGEQKPDLILDFATLTGAARVALGPDLPPVMSPDHSLMQGLADAGAAIDDPLWPMPLYAPYKQHLRSNIADMCNITEGFGFAGSITAGLFLQWFVPNSIPWAHHDIFCWNPSTRPGRPAGGEAHAVRAATSFLLNWKPKKR